MTDTATQGWWEATDDNLAAQRAARNAVMDIPLFPDLQVRLKRATGYGPHVDILQHFIYWFHPSKPKMQDRWTLYKTFAEWNEECGLSERQVKKGRAKLGEMGFVGWKRGQYRIDWVAIATKLDSEFNPDTVGGQVGEDEDEANLDTVGGQIESGHQGVQANPDTVGGQPNTGDYAGDYLQEIPLTEGGDGSESRTAVTERDQEHLCPDGDDTFTDLDTTLPSDTEQREESAKADGDEPPPDTAAPQVADAQRVAEARSVLAALFAEWPGLRDDAEAGKWRELGMTAKQLGFAEETFAPVEVELAVGGFLAQATEREAVAVHG
jgi:hypothetical protein